MQKSKAKNKKIQKIITERKFDSIPNSREKKKIAKNFDKKRKNAQKYRNEPSQKIKATKTSNFHNQKSNFSLDK